MILGRWMDEGYKVCFENGKAEVRVEGDIPYQSNNTDIVSYHETGVALVNVIIFKEPWPWSWFTSGVSQATAMEFERSPAARLSGHAVAKSHSGKLLYETHWSIPVQLTPPRVIGDR
jgi:hypothetical protein